MAIAPAMPLASAQSSTDAFLPHLRRLLNVELHFAEKVAGLRAEQFASLRETGNATIQHLAKQLLSLQEAGLPADRWPDPREVISDLLLGEIESFGDQAAAVRYREEIALRDRAERDAAVGSLVWELDRELHLSGPQLVSVREAIRKGWRDEWSQPLRLLLHPRFTPLPRVETMEASLTPRQQAVMRGLEERPMVRFGWRSDPGLEGLVGDRELPDRTVSPSPEDAVTDADSGTDSGTAAAREAKR